MEEVLNGDVHVLGEFCFVYARASRQHLSDAPLYADQKHPVGASIRVRGEDRGKTVSLTLHSSHFSSTTS